MARSRRSPPMKDRWRADEDPRERHPNRQRDKDNSDRRGRSPPPARRNGVNNKLWSRDQVATDTYIPPRQRDISRDSRYSPLRRSSISTRRQPTFTQASAQKERPLADRITRPRSPSPIKSSKRRRTHSPSPARSDRYIPGRRRESRSRERYEARDRRLPVIDRAFSPRRSSPNRIPKAGSRIETSDIDSYVPQHWRREPSPRPAGKPEPRSRSLRRRSRTPPARHDLQKKHTLPKQQELSPYSARALKAQQPAAEQPKREAKSPITKPNKPANRPSYTPTGLDQGDNDSMDGQQHSMRQNYPMHNNMMLNRPNRPIVNTRQSYGGSPSYITPNSSYHGSPQSGSPFQQGRGGWNGQQPYQGHTGYVL
jgi:hypothetical protein